MKFKAMVDEKDFEGNKMPPFEVIGYLTCEESEDFIIRQEGETYGWSINPLTLEVVKEKRHPDTNGVLPLTEIELREFTKLFFDNKDVVNRVYYDGNCIVVEWKEPDNNEFGQLYLDEVSAILWLAERFELNGGE